MPALRKIKNLYYESPADIIIRSGGFENRNIIAAKEYDYCRIELIYRDFLCYELPGAGVEPARPLLVTGF